MDIENRAHKWKHERQGDDVRREHGHFKHGEKPEKGAACKTEVGDFLTVDGLEVQYTSGGQIVRAVNGVSLSLRRGETLGLVGETGAGKTTIAKAILGILPDPPARVTGGRVILEGENLLQKPEREMQEIRGEKISMIFQDPMTALNPIISVGEQITEAIMLHSDCGREKARAQATNMLGLVGIAPERYVEYPHQFSGGMKQRVVIAMALSCHPELILADEPTTALDVTIQAQVLEMLSDLKTHFNTSMILITHDLGVVAETCDNVAIIYAGEIVECGSKRDIFKSTAHPYTKGLFGALPDIKSRSRRLHPVPGLPPDPTNLPKGCFFGPRCPHFNEECCGEIPFIEVSPGHFCRCVNKEVTGDACAD